MALQPPSNLFSIFGFHVGGDFNDLTFYKNKRGKLVWFIKAPPEKPPTDWQVSQRNRFRLCATLWQRLEPDEKKEWDAITRRCSLSLTGYNLFVWYTLTQDVDAMHTLERQSQVSVIS